MQLDARKFLEGEKEMRVELPDWVRHRKGRESLLETGAGAAAGKGREGEAADVGAGMAAEEAMVSWALHSLYLYW